MQSGQQSRCALLGTRHTRQTIRQPSDVLPHIISIASRVDLLSQARLRAYVASTICSASIECNGLLHVPIGPVDIPTMCVRRIVEWTACRHHHDIVPYLCAIGIVGRLRTARSLPQCNQVSAVHRKAQMQDRHESLGRQRARLRETTLVTQCLCSIRHSTDASLGQGLPGQRPKGDQRAFFDGLAE